MDDALKMVFSVGIKLLCLNVEEYRLPIKNKVIFLSGFKICTVFFNYC